MTQARVASERTCTQHCDVETRMRRHTCLYVHTSKIALTSLDRPHGNVEECRGKRAQPTCASPRQGDWRRLLPPPGRAAVEVARGHRGARIAIPHYHHLGTTDPIGRARLAGANPPWRCCAPAKHAMLGSVRGHGRLRAHAHTNRARNKPFSRAPGMLRRGRWSHVRRLGEDADGRLGAPRGVLGLDLGLPPKH